MPAVVIPWGDIIVNIVNVLAPTALTILSGVAAYVVGKYIPPWLRGVAGSAAQDRVNQVLTHAVQSALAQTKNAVSGQTLTIPVANEVLRKAAQYAIDQAPDLIASAAKGSVSNLVKMILARMEAADILPAGYTPPAIAPDTPTIVVPASELPPATPKSGVGFDFGEAVAKGLGK